MSIRIPRTPTETRKAEGFRVALASLIFEYVRDSHEEGSPVFDMGQVCVIADLLQQGGVSEAVQKWAMGRDLWGLLNSREIAVKSQARSSEGIERSETLDWSLPSTLAPQGEKGEAFSPSWLTDVIACLLGEIEIYQKRIKDLDALLGFSQLGDYEYEVERQLLSVGFQQRLDEIRERLSYSLACHVVQNSTQQGKERD